MNTKPRRSLTAKLAQVSLLTKMTAVTVFILTLGLFVAGAGTLAFLKPQLTVSQETALRQLLIDPRPALAVGADPSALTRNDVQFASDRFYVAVLSDTGELLVDNQNLWSDLKAPVITDITVEKVNLQGDRPFELHSEEGVAWRAVASPITGAGVSGIMLFASSTTMVNQIMAQYLTVFTGFGIAVILLGAALTRLLVIATFEPLHEVERTALEISKGDFSKRIKVAAPGTEVGHLGESLNIMLDTMDEAIVDRAKTIEQMRRFVGDAGHELRTPLVSVRGYAELYRMGALPDDEAVGQAMGRIEGEAIRMGDLVEDLLALARLDERRPMEVKKLELGPIAEDAAMDAGVQDPDREFNVNHPDDPVFVLGDELRVRQVFTNLVANALRHTPDGTPLEINLSQTPEFGVFEIVDHGHGIPAQMRTQIFDRFYRADTSRNRDTGGSGLGLAIVHSIVDRLDGIVEVVETPGGGATFRVSLPLARTR